MSGVGLSLLQDEPAQDPDSHAERDNRLAPGRLRSSRGSIGIERTCVRSRQCVALEAPWKKTKTAKIGNTSSRC
jgi:hypothetical protein